MPRIDYSYPEEFVKFEPSVNDINYLSLDKHVDIEPFYNHYKNAVNYSDHVIGEFLDVIKKRPFKEFHRYHYKRSWRRVL